MPKEISLVDRAKIIQAKESELKVLKARVKVVRKELKEHQRQLNEATIVTLLNPEAKVDTDDFGYGSIGVSLAKHQLKVTEAQAQPLMDFINEEQEFPFYPGDVDAKSQTK